MLQSLILIDSLSSASWEKKRKRKKKKREREIEKEKWPGDFFSPGLDMPCWLCHTGFSWLLGADLRVTL
jgi:hypothetical protein